MKNLPQELSNIQFFLDQPYVGVAIYQVIYPGDYTNPQETEKTQAIPSFLPGRKVQFVAGNQTFVDQSGYSEEELFNQDIYSLYTLLGAKEGFENVDFQALHRHEPGFCFLQWNRPDKKPNWIKCIVTPYSTQQAEYILSICFDITPQIIAHDKLQQFCANQSKAAHDFKGPVAGIVGWARELRRHPYDLHKGLTNIEKSANRLLDLAEASLDMNAALSGHMEIKPTWTSLEDVETMMDAIFALMVAKKGLHWTCDFPLERVQIWADELRLTQILQNLVDNALKFTAKGDIKVHCTLLGGKAPSKGIQITVSDTGIGIAQENHHKIFSPYQKLTASTDGEQGHGLGLTTTKELIQGMQGSITLTSALNQGSTFTISLPHMEYRPAPPETEEEKAMRGPEQRSMV